MDLITQTSLEALLLRATNSQNENVDTAAVDAFCALINKEKDGPQIGIKVIIDRIHSGLEIEVMQTLNMLDNCMTRCGASFQAEVNKFRFLNEMIKLVSPKYLGNETPMAVKEKILHLLYIWTIDYPKETKIKEAFEMLRKQGVIDQFPKISGDPNYLKRKTNSAFQDDERSKVLQKLLQSKNPEDILAANWLIKSMVKEDDKKAEIKSKRMLELESMQNNARLLDEMLDSYKPEISSSDELDLIKEIHETCEKFRPNLVKLATEVPQQEGILGRILSVNDELSHVFNKFNTIVVEGKPFVSETMQESNLTLLNFELAKPNEKSSEANSSRESSKSDIDVLNEIFNISNNSQCADLLTPVSIRNGDCKDKDVKKPKGLEELDILGESLLRENLQSGQKRTFSLSSDKTPLNLLSKQSENLNEVQIIKSKKDSLNTNFCSFLTNALSQNKESENENILAKSPSLDSNGDDLLLNASESLENGSNENKNEIIPKSTTTDLKLSDIFVQLDGIKPSSVPPVLLSDKNKVVLTLHFVKDRPREDVRVFVVTMINKNEEAIENFLFQAVVPKKCKVRLQPPSSNQLPAYNPFLPPAAISQIMLIANPENIDLSLKYVVSFTMDDETITEMGEVERLS